MGKKPPKKTKGRRREVYGKKPPKKTRGRRRKVMKETGYNCYNFFYRVDLSGCLLIWCYKSQTISSSKSILLAVC